MALDKKQREYYKAIGKQIKLARIERGLSQTELGRLVSKSTMTISNYERGAIQMPFHIFFDIAKALDKAPTWFLTRASIQDTEFL